MRFSQLDIKGLWLIEPKRFGDDRGYFAETFRRAEFEEATGANGDFIQDNESVSRGAVLDVAVDLRAGSPTFGRYAAVELTADNGLQLYIPRGFAHGFAVLSPEAQFQYKVDNVYMPSAECTLSFNDPSVGVDWRIPIADMTLSPKDMRGLSLDEITPYNL